MLQEKGIELKDSISIKKIAQGSTELEWFLFEAKIRQTIVDLTEPVNKKSHEVQMEA